MIVGIAPFWSESIGETYRRIIAIERMLPCSLSPQLANLLDQLLSKRADRLGRRGVQAIKQHSFFGYMRWDTVGRGTPPAGLSIPEVLHMSPPDDSMDPIVSSESNRFGTEPTFEHLFVNSSMVDDAGNMSQRPFLPPSRPYHAESMRRWLGWTWEPPSNGFQDPLQASCPSSRPSDRGDLPTALSVTTPARRVVPIAADAVHTKSAGRGQQSPRRSRHLSERQAYREMLQCVETSARKRKLASSPNRPNSHPAQFDALFPSSSWHEVSSRRLSPNSITYLEARHSVILDNLKAMDQRLAELSSQIKSTV